MPRSLAGSRIREARRRSGLTQSAVAQSAGISASYLNLIEHNRRRIGGALLLRIAEALDTRAADLTEGGNPTAIADLQALAAGRPDSAADPATAEAFAGRFPQWAQLLLSLAARVRDQDAVIAALSDRLTHDPFLSENVHAMLSHITAIRSTAGILSSVGGISQDQQQRFFSGMSAESDRLSDTAQQLADYLGKAATEPGAAATEEEALDLFLARHAYHFETLDQATGGSATAQINALLDSDPLLSAGPARALVQRHLVRYAEDARAMPLERFQAAALSHAYDPAALAAEFDQDIPAVFRRLAALRRPWIDAPRFGLITVTGSGYPLLRQPLPAFPLPRHGNACPLWPLFRGFARPGEPMRDLITHDTGAAFVTLTYAAPRHRPARFDAPADTIASMLFVAAEESPFAGPAAATVEVGTSCRICTRAACDARTQQHLLI